MPNINGILNSCNLNDKKLNIIVVGATHERHETTLSLTGHNFFSIIHGKKWNTEYGYKPKNYYQLESLPICFPYHLVLCHTSDQRLFIAAELSQKLGIPLIRHTHVLPYNNLEINDFNSVRVDLDTFISEFSMKAWQPTNPCYYINHGLDTSFWNSDNRNKDLIDDVCLSVVNFWKDRDIACGWTLWNNVIHDLPYKVAGNNPGLSSPLQPKELRELYLKSRVFLNTSLYSPVPMSLLEAMACGCAIVSTNNCMIPEIIQHGYNGFLANTPDELNNFCKYLLSNREVADKMGEQAALTIKERFNSQTFINNWDSLFREVIK